MRKVLVNLLLVAIGLGLLLGIVWIIGFIANWLMADIGRFILGLIIVGYGLCRAFINEFGE